MLRRALDANGGAEVGIDRAMNGEEACAAVRAMSEMGESYLLITMDLSMPKCNGVEATEHVRSNLYRGATTPIVALSSFDPLQPPLSECTPTGQLDAFTFCQQIEKPLTPPKAHQVGLRDRGGQGVAGAARGGQGGGGSSALHPSPPLTPIVPRHAPPTPIP